MLSAYCSFLFLTLGGTLSVLSAGSPYTSGFSLMRTRAVHLPRVSGQTANTRAALGSDGSVYVAE